MIVRDFAAEDELKVFVILDTRIIKSESENSIPLRKQIEKMQNGNQSGNSLDRVDEAVGKTCFLLNHYHSIGAEIGLITPKAEIGLEEGRHHFLTCMRQAAVALPEFVDSYTPGEFDSRISDVIETLPDCHVFLVRARESSLRPAGISGVREVEY